MMAGPITWQNIPLPSSAGIAQGAYYAQRGINEGFDSLTNALSKFESGEQAIFKRQDADATDAMKAKILGARTVEEFDALRASGALAQTTAANGGRVDMGAINSLVDGRSGVLQKRAVDEIGFNNAMLDEREAPIDRQIQARAANGDFAGARELAAQNPNLRSIATLLQGVNTAENAETVRAQSAIDYGRKLLTQSQTDQDRERTLRLQKQNDPIDLAARQATAEKTGLEIAALKRTAGDEKELREALKLAGDGAAGRTAVFENAKKYMNLSADALGPKVVPRNQDGSVALDRMDDQQRLQLSEHMRGVHNMSLQDVLAGDAAKADDTRTRLRTAGYSPVTIAKVEQTLPTMFDNTSQGPLGIDAAAQATRQEYRDAAIKTMERTYGAMVIGESTKPLDDVVSEEISRLRESAKNSKSSFYGVAESDIRNIETVAARFLRTQGIKVKGTDGRETRILPSPDQLRNLIRSMNPAQFWFTEGNVEDTFRQWTDTSGRGAADLYSVTRLSDDAKLTDKEKKK